MNPFPYTADNKRYHTYAYFLKQKYGGLVARVPLDAGFTCPNRDGTKGTGGCAFCSPRGSGDQIAGGMDLSAQYAAGIAKLQKWRDARYIPYLQAFSGTYAPIERLREVYDQALQLPGAVELAGVAHLAMSQEAYVATVCDQLEVLPGRMVIGRLTGDGPAELLLAPQWSRRKREVLNAIDQELARRDSFQGKRLQTK